MSDETKKDDEQAFDYFLDKLEGIENPDLLEELETRSGAKEALESYQNLHDQLEQMRYVSVTPGGERATKTTLIPQKISDYKILGKIGEGGMGMVYKAFDASLNRVLALKVIKASKENDEVTQRFQREAQSIARMNHSSIVHIYNLGYDEENGSFFAMEYLKGGSLAQYLREKGAMSPEEVLQIARDLGDALDHAHQRGVLHRDIKPDNIMRDEAIGSVKLTDFGIAKMMHTESEMTQSGQVFGTFAYMSPEQLRGDQLDVRSDIYSLGVTLLELLSGERVFREKSPIRLLEEIQNCQFVNKLKTQEKWKDWQDFLTCLDKCIEADKEKRYLSCSEFLKSLPTRQESEIIPQPKNRNNLFFGAAIIILMITGYIVYSNREANTDKEVIANVSDAIVHGKLDSALSSNQNNTNTLNSAQPNNNLRIEKVELPVINNSIQLNVKVRSKSELRLDAAERLENLIMKSSPAEGFHWNKKGSQGETRVSITLDTDGADLVLDVVLNHPKHEELRYRKKQRLDVDLENISTEVLQEINQFIKQ